MLSFLVCTHEGRNRGICVRRFLKMTEIMELSRNTINAQSLIQEQDKLSIKNVAIYNALNEKAKVTQMTTDYCTHHLSSKCGLWGIEHLPGLNQQQWAFFVPCLQHSWTYSIKNAPSYSYLRVLLWGSQSMPHIRFILFHLNTLMISNAHTHTK